MLPRCILQHEPVPVHWSVLGHIIPSFRPHENCMCADPRLDPVRLSTNPKEYYGHAYRCYGHDSLQLGG